MPSQPRGRQEHHRRRAARANRTASPQAPGASSPPRRAGKTNSIATAQQGGRSGRRIFCPPGPSHFPRQHIRPPLIANNHNQKKTAPPSTTNQSIKFFRGQQQRKEKNLRSNRQTDCGPTAPLRIGTLMPDQTDPQRLYESAACPTVTKSNKAGGGQVDISKGGKCGARIKRGEGGGG